MPQMIVRAILLNPDLADNFDYFNDYDDTVRWLHIIETEYPADVNAAQTAIARLSEGFNAYMKAKLLRFKK